MTDKIKAAIETLRKTVGRDYLNNKQRTEIEQAHASIDVIEQAIASLKETPCASKDFISIKEDGTKSFDIKGWLSTPEGNQAVDKIFGMDVVVDETMPPDTFKIVPKASLRPDCWRCNGTGTYGGPENPDDYKCDPCPAPAREYTDKGYLIVDKAVDVEGRT